MLYYSVTALRERKDAMSRPRRGRRTARRFPKFLLILLLFAGFFWWSNRSLQIDRFQFASQRLPAGFDGCVIVQLSDLHGAQYGEDNTALLRAVEDCCPDYIFVTGDLLDQHRRTPHSYAVDLCRRLAAIAPTYFVTGNHEWALPDVPDLKRGLEEAGTTVLTNEYVLLERGGDQIVLAGIDDPNGYAGQKSPEALAGEIRADWDGAFWMLLAHRNNYFPRQYCLLGADLVVSGHGHGGLIRLPFTDGLISVERTFFPSYTAGFYRENGSGLFVSRGLGNSGLTFRLFNRPEIAVLTLKRG